MIMGEMKAQMETMVETMNPASIRYRKKKSSSGQMILLDPLPPVIELDGDEFLPTKFKSKSMDPE